LENVFTELTRKLTSAKRLRSLRGARLQAARTATGRRKHKTVERDCRGGIAHRLRRQHGDEKAVLPPSLQVLEDAGAGPHIAAGGVCLRGA
jgi:hypothetical protein